MRSVEWIDVSTMRLVYKNSNTSNVELQGFIYYNPNSRHKFLVHEVWKDTGEVYTQYYTDLETIIERCEACMAFNP